MENFNPTPTFQGLAHGLRALAHHSFREVWSVRVWDGWICLGNLRARRSTRCLSRPGTFGACGGRARVSLRASAAPEPPSCRSPTRAPRLRGRCRPPPKTCARNSSPALIVCLFCNDCFSEGGQKRSGSDWRRRSDFASRRRTSPCADHRFLCSRVSVSSYVESR